MKYRPENPLCHGPWEMKYGPENSLCQPNCSKEKKKIKNFSPTHQHQTLVNPIILQRSQIHRITCQFMGILGMSFCRNPKKNENHTKYHQTHLFFPKTPKSFSPRLFLSQHSPQDQLKTHKKQNFWVIQCYVDFLYERERPAAAMDSGSDRQHPPA
nr:hypothetical protein Itr_chr13CG09730 [Ipomoea trifida]